jgi:hypothetical protein
MTGRTARRAPGLARFSLAWGLGLFAALQLALTLVIELGCPEFRDLEYASKIARLRACRTAEPDRPSLVALGSSRLARGLRPELLVPRGAAPLVFNYAFTGAGPVRELIALRQLLRAGVRPNWLVVEIHPALLHYVDYAGEDNWMPAPRLGWHDLRLLRRYAPRPGALSREWCWSRLAPVSAHRLCLLSCLAPTWLPQEVRQDGWRLLDRTGGMLPAPSATADEYCRGVRAAFDQYQACFQDFQISERSDRALRGLLRRCRREGIRPLLLTMPESTAFRSWYLPAARVVIDAYLSGLSRDTAVPWIDARTWMADEDFSDGHHLAGIGAARFTERFGREVLGTLVEGVR